MMRISSNKYAFVERMTVDKEQRMKQVLQNSS